MKSQKKGIDLMQMAAQARANTGRLALPGNLPDNTVQPTPTNQTIPTTQRVPPADDVLQQLLKNIGRTVMLPINMLVIKDNIRKIYETKTKGFDQLVESIRRVGIKQNLQGSIKVEKDGSWEIICTAGQRRLLAARMIEGQDYVPVRLDKFSDEISFIDESLIENLLRENLHTLDVAIAYLRLYNLGRAAEDIAESYEREKDTVMKMIRLAKYPQRAHEIIRIYHKKFNSNVLLNKFVAKRWPSEEALIGALEDFALNDQRRDHNRLITGREVKDIETRVKEKYGVKVKSKGSTESGEIILSWNSPDEFQKVQKYLSSNLESNDEGN